MKGAVRAYKRPDFDYYELTKPLGVLPEGAVFFHDTEDDVYGSIGSGCLKLCWTSEGNCVGGICGGMVIFHECFINSDLFKPATPKSQRVIRKIEKLEKELAELKAEVGNEVKE